VLQGSFVEIFSRLPGFISYRYQGANRSQPVNASALSMVSATPAASVRGQSTSALEAKGVCCEPPVAAPVIEAGLCTSKKGMDLQGGKGMRQVFSGMAMASLGLAIVLTLPHTAWSYPSFQRLPYVSDAAPFCAGCHSRSVSLPSRTAAEASKNQVYTTNTTRALEEGAGGFKVLELRSVSSSWNRPKRSTRTRR